MRTSKKLLLALMGLLIVLVTISAVLLRSHLWVVVNQANLASGYEPVAIDSFTRLNFSSHWHVTIRQGKNFNVEVKEKATSLPLLTNRQGVLYFQADTIQSRERYARITVPILTNIKAQRYTQVYMEDFELDSLQVVMDQNGAFTSVNNKIKYLSIQSTAPQAEPAGLTEH